MPIIRGVPKKKPVDSATRQRLLDQLKSELAGEVTLDGPVIFEIPLEELAKFDVIVVWNTWQNLRSYDRTGLILDAYEGRDEQIVQTLGLSVREAIQQDWLPIEVRANLPTPVSEAAKVRAAMLDEGALTLDGGHIELRFPNLAMAEAAFRRLKKKLPKANWEIDNRNA